MMQLDAQQQAACFTKSKKALVVASAGSGKTRTLIERIAYLIEDEHVSPYEIICCTFTRKAAGEMKERLEQRIGSSAYRLKIGTMHSIALDFIHRFGECIGLRSHAVTVYSEWEESFLIREIATDLGILKKKAWKVPKSEVVQMFSNYYQAGKEPNEKSPLHVLFKSVISRCRENNAITYGSLLLGFKLLIPELRKHHSFKHVLVDEVQDLDPLQWQIVNELCHVFGASQFVVGDDSQSIYSFRGAVPEYLIAHKNDFDIYNLESNYRSLPAIVNSANRLIINNTQRLDNTMRPVRDGGDGVHYLEWMDSKAIACAIYDEPVDALLARNHILLEAVSRELDALDIPYEYIGQQSKITNTEPFRRFHAFIKLIVNPFDNFSFLLIKDLLGLDKKRYQEIRLKATIRHQSHFQVWCETSDPTTHAFYFFTDIECQNNLFTSVRVLQDRICHDMAFYPTLSFVEKNIQKLNHVSVADYLDWLATYDIQDEMVSEKSDRIQIMTIHASKGLEWPAVMLAGCNEGILPSKRAEVEGNIEDERRLMYVAATRAKDKLIVTSRPTIKENAYGKVYNNPISRFVQEMQ